MYTGSLVDNDFCGGGETKEEGDETNKILKFKDPFTMEYPWKYKLNWFFTVSFIPLNLILAIWHSGE
jgi:hypothetical protein